MAVNFSIKGVPEATAARLRERAERNHRSLQGELMAIIESAAHGEDVAARAVASPPARGLRTIEEIAAEHRLRFPDPILREPLAVDILRADRDAR
jgi:hypothetical protein